jgi:anaerobic sulfite reductase subunit B
MRPRADLQTPGPMLPIPYRVAQRRRELADTVTLALEPVDGPAIRYQAGQFNMLYAFGIGEAPISISGDPGAGGPLLHTVRAVGAVTRALCAARPGDVLGVRGPFGTDWDLETAAGCDVVVIAGGIGLAPLRPAVARLLAERDRFGRISILVGARSPGTLLYPRELRAWRGRFDVQVEVTVDHAEPGWYGHVGVVTELLAGLPLDPGRTVGLVCGPEVMLRLAARGLVDRDVPAESVRVSLERNMKCAVGQCGHCQLGPVLICRDGAVFDYRRVASLLAIKEV